VLQYHNLHVLCAQAPLAAPHLSAPQVPVFSSLACLVDLLYSAWVAPVCLQTGCRPNSIQCLHSSRMRLYQPHSRPPIYCIGCCPSLFGNAPLLMSLGPLADVQAAAQASLKLPRLLGLAGLLVPWSSHLKPALATMELPHGLSVASPYFPLCPCLCAGPEPEGAQPPDRQPTQQHTAQASHHLPPDASGWVLPNTARLLSKRECGLGGFTR